MNDIMKYSILIISLLLKSLYALFNCDFESVCDDFILDNHWGLTDGEHPILMDHDHTLNQSTGHYIFYQPMDDGQATLSEIKMKDWFEPSLNTTMCFSAWYFSRDKTFSFTIELIQGDDQQLSRVFKEISYQNQSIDDWTEIKVVLPMERIKVAVRLNITAEHLIFDDFSINVCDRPQPPIPEVSFFCDFESSCAENFFSLPFYPYQWQVIPAGQPPEQGGSPPRFDFTFGNQSGHYVWLNNFRRSRSGRVGYYATQQAFYTQQNQSYCLNFQYFQYDFIGATKLKVYAWMPNSSDAIQLLWPSSNPDTYAYSSYRWSWGIINLPLGHYHLLFRVETNNNMIFPGSFALDNVGIVSCDYPSYSLSPMNYTHLSFYCNFDDLSSCGMTSSNGSLPLSKYNFSVVTGAHVPKPRLGPNHDHTTNSTLGGFIYWNQMYPLFPEATGVLSFQRSFEQTTGLCIQFAYYIRSSLTNWNATNITLFSSDNSTGFLWTQSLDDSQGWQIVTLAFPKNLVRNEFYFNVNQSIVADVSVAFDDISIQQCNSFPDVTTTTTTTTTVITTTTTTTTTTMTTPSATATSTTTTTTITTSSTTTSTSASSTSTSSSTQTTITASVTKITSSTTSTGISRLHGPFSYMCCLILVILSALVSL